MPLADVSPCCAVVLRKEPAALLQLVVFRGDVVVDPFEVDWFAVPCYGGSSTPNLNFRLLVYFMCVNAVLLFYMECVPSERLNDFQTHIAFMVPPACNEKLEESKSGRA